MDLCIVHGEALVMCPSCEHERALRMRARILRKLDEAVFASGRTEEWINGAVVPISREMLVSTLQGEIQ